MEQEASKQIVAFLQTSGAASGLIIFLCWFLTFRVWPWFTKEYFPALLSREKAEAAERAVLRETIGSLDLSIRTMPANFQLAITPHFDRLSSQTGELTGMRPLMENHDTMSKTRHEMVMARIDTLQTTLTNLYLGLHAPKPNGGSAVATSEKA